MTTPILGIPELDSEHQKLHATVSELEKACARNYPEEIDTLLSRLVSETRQHFASEEAHMRSQAYPLLPQHSEEHEHLIRALESIEMAHRRGDLPAQRSMIAFVWDWLNDHVNESDREYAAYLRTT